MVDKLDIRQPEFWANLLGAVANFNIAAIPDSVASALMQEQFEHQKANERIRKEVTEAKERQEKK